jgi:hypothetical protein
MVAASMVVGDEPKAPSAKMNDPTLTSLSDAPDPFFEYVVAVLT